MVEELWKEGTKECKHMGLAQTVYECAGIVSILNSPGLRIVW